MKKVLALSLVMVAPAAFSAPVAFHIDCPNGGARDISGEYTPRTGEFEATTTVTDCAIGPNAVTNGSVNASGIYLGDSLQVDVATELTRDFGDSTETLKCSRSISGTYDAKSGVVEGVSSSNCDKTGKIYAPILELVAGFSEQQSLQKSAEADNASLIASKWSCGGTNSLTIREDGTATLVADGTMECTEGETLLTRYIGKQCAWTTPNHEGVWGNDTLSVIEAEVYEYNRNRILGSRTIVSSTEPSDVGASYPIDCRRVFAGSR